MKLKSSICETDGVCDMQTTAEQYQHEWGGVSSAGQMIAMLAGMRLSRSPVYTLTGRTMDGVRVQSVYMPECLSDSVAEGRQKTLFILNAIRDFAVQQLPGYLYIDLSLRDFIALALDDLLAAVDRSTLPVQRLVIVLTGEPGDAVDRQVVVQGVATLREAGIQVGARLLSEGYMQLALICLLKPQCLALYASDRALLPARNIAGLLASLPRMTGELAPPVIADNFDTMVSGSCSM